MAMMDAVGAAVAALDVPLDMIRAENFAGMREASAKSGAAFEATSVRGGKSVQARLGDTILDIAQSNGVDIAFSCGGGACGAIKLRVRSGRTEMPRTDMLSEAEQEAGYVLAWQARPQGNLEIGA